MYSLNNLSLSTLTSIKNATTNDLVQTFIEKKGKNIPSWIEALRTGDGKPLHYSFAEVWAELLLRKTDEKLSAVKNSIEAVSVDSMLGITPNSDVVIKKKNGDQMTLRQDAGYHVPKKIMDKPTTKTEVGIEIVMDMVQFHVKKCDEAKKTIEYISPSAAKAVCMPQVPFSEMFFDTTRREMVMWSNMSKILRYNLSSDFNGTMDKLFCLSTPSPRINYKEGIFPIDVFTPKFDSWSKFYSFLKTCREYRGKDSGAQSRFSCGYYFGHMSEHFYRTAVTVGNITRLGIVFKTKCLEIREIKGDMTLAVVNSLASQGWSIRVLYDLTKKVVNTTNTAGVYRMVNFDGLYLRHLALNDTVPQVVSKVFKPSTGINKWEDDTQNAPINAIVFSTIYGYEAVYERFKGYLLPSLSAHTGQVLICSKQTGDLDPINYMRRCVKANLYKNTFVFKRALYYPQDPYKLDCHINFVPGKVYETDEEDQWEPYEIKNNVFIFSPQEIKQAEEKILSEVPTSVLSSLNLDQSDSGSIMATLSMASNNDIIAKLSTGQDINTIPELPQHEEEDFAFEKDED